MKTQLNLDHNFFRAFPDYKDVFAADLKDCEKFFLPICSINTLIFSKKDQWLHFISAKEIYDGRLGENTTEYHTHRGYI